MNAVPDVRGAGGYMARHSRSFRFATMMLGPELRGRIERVYAWCRYTDDIVDRAPAGATSADMEAALDEWAARSRAAFEGTVTGFPLLDTVMADLRESGGSFDHPEAILRGVRSDARFAEFESLEDLRRYTHDVAAVVGLWLCALHRIRDPWMLHRAAALGHAMQLTNILRDVGEDLQSGRVYLPKSMLAARGVTVADLAAMQREGRVSDAYRQMMRDLIVFAEADYRLAREAIPYLPDQFGRAVAAAAAIYGGIHAAIRENGYDSLTRRARTTGARKAVLAAGALWDLRRRRVAASSARVIALRQGGSPPMGDATPHLQVARLRGAERRG